MSRDDKRCARAWTLLLHLAVPAACAMILAMQAVAVPSARAQMQAFRARGSVTARPACGFREDGTPDNRLPSSREFPRGAWRPAASLPELMPTVGPTPEDSPRSTRDAARVDFDAKGPPGPGRWTCLEAKAAVRPGTAYTFSFSVLGPPGSFVAGRGVAGAGFSRIPLNGRWQRVHLTEIAKDSEPTLRIGLAAHDDGEAALPERVSVLLWGPQLTEGREIVPYQPTDDRLAPEWPLELVAPGAVRHPCGPEDRGEPAATNLLRWSALMHRTPWSTEGLGTAPWPQAWSPVGLPDACEVPEAPGPGPHRFLQEFDCAGSGPVAASIYVKPGSRSACMLALRVPGAHSEGRYDLAAITASGGSERLPARITRVGRGWLRIEIAAMAAGPGIGVFELSLLERPDGSVAYEGHGRPSMAAWGAQVESGTTATSHVPTFRIPESREADEPTGAPSG